MTFSFSSSKTRYENNCPEWGTEHMDELKILSYCRRVGLCQTIVFPMLSLLETVLFSFNNTVFPANKFPNLLRNCATEAWENFLDLIYYFL